MATAQLMRQATPNVNTVPDHGCWPSGSGVAPRDATVMPRDAVNRVARDASRDRSVLTQAHTDAAEILRHAEKVKSVARGIAREAGRLEGARAIGDMLGRVREEVAEVESLARRCAETYLALASDAITAEEVRRANAGRSFDAALLDAVVFEAGEPCDRVTVRVAEDASAPRLRDLVHVADVTVARTPLRFTLARYDADAAEATYVVGRR